LYYLEFDGVDDFLVVQAPISEVSRANFFQSAAVLRPTTDGVGFLTVTDIPRFATYIRSEFDNRNYYDGIVRKIAYAPSTSDVSVVSWHLSSGSGEVFLDGLSLGTAPYNTINWDGSLYLGGDKEASRNTEFDMFGLIMCFDSVTPAEITDTESYLASKSGVTL
jgi:hypothetical protein